MCGIVGYVGKRQGVDIITNGLKALEYRGYDSAGICLLPEKSSNSAFLLKQAGRVESLINSLEASNPPLSTIGIGHTRWATHGLPTTTNAHPHFNHDKSIMVAHNGIIENFHELKAFLVKNNYKFKSDTDTEVLPHLIDFYFKQTNSLNIAFEKVIHDIRGAYAILMVSTIEPDRLYLAKLSSPLVIGLGKDEFIVASDPTALLAHTKDVVYLDDNEIAIVDSKEYKIKHIKNNQYVRRTSESIEFDVNEVDKGDYHTFMLKEIYEAPQTIRSAILGRLKFETNTIKLGGLESVLEQLKFIDRIVIVACGTSYYAGLVGEYLIEELAGIPVEVQLASEFKYRKEPFSRSTALLAISQSGETADTIAALKKVEDYGVLRLGVINTVGSTISRMTDAGVYCHAGPELAVASTKAFIAQVTVLMLIALLLSDGKTDLYRPLLKELASLPYKAQLVLDQSSHIEKVAEKYKNYRDFLFIGRGYDYPVALEGALKLKEVSYIHAEGYAAGEMKHGPLAMINKDFPTFVFACTNPLQEKTISNIEEIRARQGPLIAITNKKDLTMSRLADEVLYIPKSLPQTNVILEAIVAQLFAYHISNLKGIDVDKPRNLAKSVTVE